jgi:hypothetical protein
VNAAMVAIGANMSGDASSLTSSQWKNGSRSFADGIIVYELTIPAMLNVLLGAPNVMLHSAAFGLTDAKGIWVLPHRAMSE